MDKYKKVIKPKEAQEEKGEEEIRLTATGSISSYVSRAAKVYNELNKPKVVISATGNALTKAVQTAEVIKRRFKGLHQITALTSQEIVDTYEPLEEGLEVVTDTRTIPCITITLSKEPLDTSDKGYQPPIDESLVEEFDPEKLTAPRGRGGGGRGAGRGAGRGKGRGSSKGKGKGKEADKGKGKGKGKEADKGKGKSKGKGKGKEADSGKGKGKGKDDGKGKGKGKSKGDYGGKDSKGKGKGKDYGPPRDYGGSKGYSKGYDDWGSKGGYGRKGYDDYGRKGYDDKGYGKGSYSKGGYGKGSYDKGYGKGPSYDDWGKGKSKGKGWY